ncbi:MAG: TlpA family protein disulfide reductase [Armatimonadota bacterium]
MRTRILALFGLLLVLGITGGIVAKHYAVAAGKEDKGIDFTLTDINGKKVKLSDYRGKVVVVDMWATWCHYCVKEIPDVMAIQAAAYKAAGKDKTKTKLQFIGITVDKDKNAVKSFVKENKINYPILFTDEAQVKALGEVYGLPTKFVIDAKGKVVETVVGARDKAGMQKIIDKYVK